jgi:hypothetical protein
LQVFIALAGMRRLMSELKNKDVLEEFGGRRADGDPDVAPWNQLLDADLVRPPLASVCECLSFCSWEALTLS